MKNYRSSSPVNPEQRKAEMAAYIEKMNATRVEVERHFIEFAPVIYECDLLFPDSFIRIGLLYFGE